MLTATFDDKLGIVRSVSSGSTPQDEIEAYMRGIGVLMRQARARHGRVLHLVDASETAVQPQPMITSFSNMSLKLCRNEDKTAVFVRSALVKMQSRRAVIAGQHASFDSEGEALAWLMA